MNAALRYFLHESGNRYEFIRNQSLFDPKKLREETRWRLIMSPKRAVTDCFDRLRNGATSFASLRLQTIRRVKERETANCNLRRRREVADAFFLDACSEWRLTWLDGVHHLVGPSITRLEKQKKGTGEGESEGGNAKGMRPQFVLVTFRAGALPEPWKGLQRGVAARNLVIHRPIYYIDCVRRCASVH
jgi:hypothetical protein